MTSTPENFDKADAAATGLIRMGLDASQRHALRDGVHPSAVLRALLDASPDIVSYKDRNRRYVYCNTAHAAWLGVSREDVAGRTVEKILGEDSPLTRLIRARDESVLLHGRTLREITQELSPGGIYTQLEVIAFPVRSDGGQVTGVATIGRDVSTLFAREKALEEERERRELAINGSQDGIWDFRLTRNEIALSPRACELLGLDADEETITPAQLMSLAHPDDAARYLHAYQHHLRSREKLFTEKLRIARSGAADHWLFIRGASLRDDQGRVYRIAGSVSDISEQVRVERALRESERRFIDFTRSAGDWFWETDADHYFTYLSPNVRKIIGLDQRDEIGKPRFTLADRALTTGNWEAHRRDLAARRAFRGFEYERVLPDGRRRHFRINGVPVFREDGTFAGYRGTGLDITDELAGRERLVAAEARLFEAIETMADAAALFDAEDRLLIANSTYLNRWCKKLSAEELDGITFEQILRHTTEAGYHKVDDNSREAFVQWRMAKHRNPGEPFVVELTDGAYQFSENRTAEGGRFVLVRDITALIDHEQALQASESRFRTLYDENPSMFFTMDIHGVMRSVNAHGTGQLGYPRGHLNGLHVTAVHLPEDHDEILSRVAACFASPNHTRRWEIRKRHRNGETFWVRETGRAVENVDGELTLLTVCEDISEARRLSEELTYQATHDALTGLVNRREFERRVLRVLDTVRRDSSEHALCYIDLDDFKVINDTSGHAAGDQLLRMISALMSSKVRRRDTVARLGGDEFGVLFEHCPPERAEMLASELREAIQEFRFSWKDKVFRIGASVGLVALSGEFDQLSDVFAAADEACYAAKESGGDRVHRFHSDDAKLIERRDEMHWLTRLNAALDEERLRLAYQMIEPADPSLTRGMHYEMLVRLEDDDGELVLPGSFLSAAERYNQLTKIDTWVVTRTLQWLSADPAWLNKLDLCAINLSGQALGDERFIAQIVDVLDSSPVPAAKLCFEITETTAISNLPAANRFISQLRERGVRFALDDFGSGLSSFAYLKTLPVDFLKIDGVFVQDILDDPIDRAMVRSINEIGHVMGKLTVAEFVESEAIAAELRKIGVDYLQGYQIGKPILIEKF